MDNPTLLNILISWFPMLLLVAVWVFFMRKMGGKKLSSGIGDVGLVEEMRRQNKILERIAAAIEKR